MLSDHPDILFQQWKSVKEKSSSMSNGNKARIQVKRSLICFKCHGFSRGYLKFEEIGEIMKVLQANKLVINQKCQTLSEAENLIAQLKR